MIGLMQIGTTMGQITYNQLKREQTMNKQHTFCFKIEDLSTEGLHDFLEKASQNHLFADLPNKARDCHIDIKQAFDNPNFFVNGDVEFLDHAKFKLIGINNYGHVVTNRHVSNFGKDTVFIPHATHSIVDYNLQLAAPNKQEQKTTEAPKPDGIVQLFQTADGRSFKTLSEAECHHGRVRLIEKLADDTGCQYDDAERALNWLEANHPRLKED